jgi:hypothetical protein
MKGIRFIILLCMLLLLTYTPLDAASKAKRGVQITPRPSPSLESLYNQSYAVIIGINAYDKWPSLEYAVNDAKSIQKRLKDMGFDTITLLDNYATRENILKVLGDELPKKVEKNDRVIIFFAGHGQPDGLHCPCGQRHPEHILNCHIHGSSSSVFQAPACQACSVFN